MIGVFTQGLYKPPPITVEKRLNSLTDGHRNYHQHKKGSSQCLYSSSAHIATEVPLRISQAVHAKQLIIEAQNQPLGCIASYRASITMKQQVC